jgi:hypothetical protein
MTGARWMAKAGACHAGDERIGGLECLAVQGIPTSGVLQSGSSISAPNAQLIRKLFEWYGGESSNTRLPESALTLRHCSNSPQICAGRSRRGRPSPHSPTLTGATSPSLPPTARRPGWRTFFWAAAPSSVTAITSTAPPSAASTAPVSAPPLQSRLDRRVDRGSLWGCRLQSPPVRVGTAHGVIDPIMIIGFRHDEGPVIMQPAKYASCSAKNTDVLLHL